MSSLIAGSMAYSQRVGLPCVATIGNFDGVHLGHQQLLTETIARAKELGVLSCAYTFEPPPRTLLAPQLLTPRIHTWQEKVETLLSFGLDCVVVEEFSLTFAGYGPDWFSTEILGRRLQAQALVVGYDFRYGKARGGTVETLRRSLPNLDIQQVSALVQDDEPISSSRIRTLVANGEVNKASSLLSRPHTIRGIVIPGKKEGRRLGYPTANIYTSDSLIPERGVYAVTVQINRGKELFGMANLGNQPTFTGGRFQIEVHIFDFEDDIFGDEISWSFFNRIRSESLFTKVSDLILQLESDKKLAVQILLG
jgi:riboflavin kinase/FMN adenylyltransferase